MAEWSGPFDTTTDLSEARWRALLRALAPNGVLDGYGGTGLAVSASGDLLSVNVAAGNAHVEGALYENTAAVNKTNTANGGGSARPDRVVLRYDAAANSVSLVVREGTAGGAAPPTLTQVVTGQWDIPLARWSRASGGGIGSLVDERQFVTPDGLTVMADAAVTTAVPLTALVPNPRPGQRVLTLPSAREYRWSGTPYSYWERTDPAPLLELGSTDGGTVSTVGSWTSALTGSSALSGTFVAPLSGRVWVDISAYLSSPPGGGVIYATARITGGAFTFLPSAPNNDALKMVGHAATDEGDGGKFGTGFPVSGLAPGTVYTATFMTGLASGSSGLCDQRELYVRRA